MSFRIPIENFKNINFLSYILDRTIHISQERWERCQTEKNFQLLNPTSKYVIAWNMFMLFFDLFYTCLILPLFLSFSVLYFWSPWFIIELIVNCILVINIVVNSATGFIVKVDNELLITTNLKTCWFIYLRYGTLIMDIVSTLPLLIATIITLIARNSNFETLLIICSVFMFLRAFRIFNIFKNGVIINSFVNVANIPLTVHTTKAIMAIYLSYVCFVVVNALACLWFGVARWTGYDNTWVSHVNLEHSPNIENYVASIYFVVTTFTTVGYGDIVAIGTPERLVAILIMLCGVGIFLILIGLMSDMFVTFRYIQQTQQLINRIRNVNMLLNMNIINEDTKKTITYYFNDYLVHNEIESDNWYELFEDLPSTLKVKIMEAILTPVIPYIDELRHLRQQQINVIVSNLTYLPVKWYGQEICHKGERLDYSYILIEGKVLSIEGEDREINAPVMFSDGIIENGFCSETIITISRCLIFKIDTMLLKQIMYEVGI